MKCIYCGHIRDADAPETFCPHCKREKDSPLEWETAYREGMLAEEDTRYEDAMRSYRAASRGGIPCAAYAMSRVIHKSGLRKKDEDLYAFWLQYAAYTEGEGAYRYSQYLKQNEREIESAYFLRLGADKGHIKCCLAAGFQAMSGKDLPTARHYFKQAAPHSVLAKCVLFFLGKNKEDTPAPLTLPPKHNESLYDAAGVGESLGLWYIAKTYYLMASLNHFVPALERLSHLSIQEGETHDEATCEACLISLGEMGKLDAYIKLGDYYKKGRIGGTPDPARAYQMYVKAARGGDNFAMVLVGDACFHGVGVDKDTFSALRWYDMAAANGNPLGESRGVATREEGAARYREALEAMENGKTDEGIALCREASELGHAKAVCTLGDCYLSGLGVKKSYKMAIKWYEFGIGLGDPIAKYRLGQLYATNLGVMFDPVKAEALLREASEAGCKPAEAEILRMKQRRNAKLSRRLYSTACSIYHRGDKSGAISFLVLATKMGCGRAAYLLGCMFDCGDGMPRDRVRAQKYLDKAKELGFDGDGNRYMGRFIKHLKQS